jgi:hypothetical protein
MKKSNWLSKEDFDKLDELFSKMGYGGYYDFLECLKHVGIRFNAFTVDGKRIDPNTLKTIPEVMSFLMLGRKTI